MNNVSDHDHKRSCTKIICDSKKLAIYELPLGKETGISTQKTNVNQHENTE
jgi:hypothetical protein